MAWLIEEDDDERPLWHMFMDQSARSSLSDAISLYVSDDVGPQHTRRLVLALHQAIELFLKSRLARDDPRLILKDAVGSKEIDRRPGIQAPPPRLTIHFKTAVERAAKRSGQPQLYSRLGILNELRNGLAHLGYSRMPARMQDLAIHQALAFAIRHLSGELGLSRPLVDPDSLKKAELRLEHSETQADQDFDAKLQQFWDVHHSLDESERERRRTKAIPPDEPFMTEMCPACGELAFVELAEWLPPVSPGEPPDRARVIGFACPICNLHLADGELDQYQYVAMEYVDDQEMHDSWERWKNY